MLLTIQDLLIATKAWANFVWLNLGAHSQLLVRSGEDGVLHMRHNMLHFLHLHKTPLNVIQAVISGTLMCFLRDIVGMWLGCCGWKLKITLLQQQCNSDLMFLNQCEGQKAALSCSVFQFRTKPHEQDKLSNNDQNCGCGLLLSQHQEPDTKKTN